MHQTRLGLVYAYIGQAGDVVVSLCPAYELIGRIRLSSSDTVLAEAENVLKRITEQYFSPNLSVEEARALVESDTADPLKSFGEACRAELKSMLAAI